MNVQRARHARQRLVGSCCAVAVALACALAVAGCGGSNAKAASRVQSCGATKTAANVPVKVEVYRGTVSCSVAMTIEKNYAEAIVSGRAPGSGGGGPVPVSGWTCQGFPTPKVLQTGDVSKCAKDGTEIIEILKTSG